MLPRLRLKQQLLSSVPLAPICPIAYSPPAMPAFITPQAKYACRRDTGSTSPYPRSWSRQGRNSSFSRQWQPSNGDTSLDSLQRRSRSISNCLQRFQARRQEAELANRERQGKKKLAQILKRRYQIRFSLLDLKVLSKDAMTRRAVEKRSFHLAQVAARRMLAWLAQVRIRRNVQLAKAREHLAAYRIQLQWKRFRVSTMQRSVLVPRRQAEKVQQAAVTIQRCYRSYLARERRKKAKVLRDVHNLHFHYERVRLRAMTDKAPVILRSWQQYRMRKKAKAAKAEQVTRRRISKYFTGLVGDVFNTSSKAPPMRPNIDRPGGLQLTGKKPRADGSEAQSEKSPLVRSRSRTESTSEVQRNGARKPSQKRKEAEEPMTAPVDTKSRPGQRRTVSKRLELIEEIS